ncbi:glycosyltransferase family 2 protein [Mycoplana dimorpha]|uniref:glycosyltransferase family 2 protein n=1 Tax=Mycoplana dimorpha TaxID=28320 RepID=UPI0014747855|nr:glycosyltransferase family A protein [Mycoplana dimorpha]
MGSKPANRPKPTWRRALRTIGRKISFWQQQQWPSSRRLIPTAYEIGERNGYQKAVAWAERHSSVDVSHGIHVLRANRDKADAAAWITHLNAYLAQYGTSPLVLADAQGSLIHRLRSTPKKIITDGPLVSVIMCAYNAQDTIEMAARSILSQSWRPFELLIVDDGSTDGTAAIAFQLAREDARVRVHLNAANVGPYVGRNLALRHARGAYVTCHDADDWAHPERLEHQIEFLHRKQLAGTLSGMLRMRVNGQFARLTTGRRKERNDGILQFAAASALFERKAFDVHLQYWDSVRFGADSELIDRAELAFRHGMQRQVTFSMICLDHENSLTNHPETGLSERHGLSKARKLYSAEYKAWHAQSSSSSLKMDFPQYERRFKAPAEAVVRIEDVSHAVSNSSFDTPNGGLAPFPRVNASGQNPATCFTPLNA